MKVGLRCFLPDALYPLGPVATLRFCHLRPRCISKQRRTTNVIITDRVWWIWCDAGLAAVATRPQRSPHSVASNSRPDYFAATRSRSLFLTKNECCVSAAAAAIWEIQWRRTYAAAGPSGYRGWLNMLTMHIHIHCRHSAWLGALCNLDIVCEHCPLSERTRSILKSGFY